LSTTIRQPGSAPKATDLASVLKGELIDAVRDYCDNEPRSQQRTIGASEIGSPCDRQLALKSLGYDGGGSKRDDPWAAFIGTAVHKKLEDVFEFANVRFIRDCSTPVYTPGHGPWKIETRVEFAPGLKGTGDLFSYNHRTVIDHKVPADATMKKAVSENISPTYNVQVDCYGLGFERAGYDVENVAIAYWPRGTGAVLNKLHIYVRPYDRANAEAAVKRWLDIVNAAIELDLERYPERRNLFATADAPCKWCPFFDWTGRREGVNCNGHKK
jgi:hypothetical protein